MSHAAESESPDVRFALRVAIESDEPIDTDIRVKGLGALEDLEVARTARGKSEQLVVPLLVEADEPLSTVMQFFEADLAAADPVVIRDADGIVAKLTMESLASLVLRTDPPSTERDAILGWVGRTGLHWCVRGRHSTTTWPCERKHGA